jgi:hypothetical protein
VGPGRDRSRVDGLASRGNPRGRRPFDRAAAGRGAGRDTGAAQTEAPRRADAAPVTIRAHGDVGVRRVGVYPVAAMNQPLGTGDQAAWAATISKQNG